MIFALLAGEAGAAFIDNRLALEALTMSGAITTTGVVSFGVDTEQKAKNKSGVVKNEELQKQALEKIKKYAESIGLNILGEIDSPLLGGSGNKEYFLLLGQGEALS